MYTVEPDPAAHEQVAALPRPALAAYLELRALLEVSPWSGRSANPDNPKANILTHPFGGYGLATYLILDDQRRVIILKVLWAGP